MIVFIVINGILLVVTVLLLVAESSLVVYGKSSVMINGNRKITVPRGENLLTCLNREKLFIPSACGSKAICGLCKLTVVSGGGTILSTEELFLSRAEQEEGIRLACQVRIRQNMEISIPEHMLGAEEFEARVVGIRSLTHDIRMLSVEILDGKRMPFKPGQYVQLKIPGTDEFRAYSIASPPGNDTRFDLIIKHVPGGLCSTYVHWALEEGDRMLFTGPFGDFFLRKEGRDIIAIGGGCGMAPMRSIIHHLVQQGMPRKVYYFFGARTRKDLFFTDELNELAEKFQNFQYIPALSEPDRRDAWSGEVGLITRVAEKHLGTIRNNLSGPVESYLCGSPPMIDAAMAVLIEKGLSPKNIHFDKF